MIGIIIVSYGRSELLDKTLESLFENTIDANVCIVDNGSGQSVIDVLIKYNSQLSHVHLLKENKGKSYAWNKGAYYWDINKYITHYLFCDSDIIFKPNWQKDMMDVYNEFYPDGLGILSGFDHNRKGQIIKKNGFKLLKKRYPPGCCILMHRNVYDVVGKFDESIKIGTVDTRYITEALKCRWWSANVTPTAIEHIGQEQRTFKWDKGQGKTTEFLYYD